MRREKKPERTGIKVVGGKGVEVSGNRIEGFDVGIAAEGANDSRFAANEVTVREGTSGRPWYERPVGKTGLAIAAMVIGAVILFYLGLD